jgi:hypothetical protein
MKHTKFSLVATKEIGPEVSGEKTTYVFSFVNSRQKSHNIKTGNDSFENVAKFKYFGTTLTMNSA